MWPLPATDDEHNPASYREIATELRRDEDLINLCARGARKPTIQNLLGRISENRIKDIHVLFHGDRKGAKTRGHDYYTESIARRRDASLIVAWYRQLSQMDMPVVARYIRLHDLHLAQHTVETPYDIDETIRLICSIDLAKLKSERCPHCGVLIVMQSGERNPEDYCFQCNEKPRIQRRARASTADPIKFPTESEIKAVFEKEIEPKRKAINLVLCGARPQEVELLVPGMEAFARRLWPMLLGMSAPQGSMPFTSVYYVEKVERRRHAAYVIKTFLQLKKLGLTGADLFLALFRNYLHAFAGNSELMHFSRVRGIVHFHLHGDLKLVRCAECGAHYVILRDELAGDQSCPSCRQIVGTQRNDSHHAKQPVAARPAYIPPLPGDSKRRRTTKFTPENRVFSTAI